MVVVEKRPFFSQQAFKTAQNFRGKNFSLLFRSYVLRNTQAQHFSSLNLRLLIGAGNTTHTREVTHTVQFKLLASTFLFSSFLFSSVCSADINRDRESTTTTTVFGVCVFVLGAENRAAQHCHRHCQGVINSLQSKLTCSFLVPECLSACLFPATTTERQWQPNN